MRLVRSERPTELLCSMGLLWIWAQGILGKLEVVLRVKWSQEATKGNCRGQLLEQASP